MAGECRKKNISITINIQEKKMKKILLTLLLFVVSNSAMAEWVYINKSIDTFYYTNPETIQKSGGYLSHNYYCG